MMRYRLSLFACVAALIGGCAAPNRDAALREASPFHAPEIATGYQDKQGHVAKKYMVAAANPLAADAGYQMLKAGGSAIDAAIATQMVLTLVEPQSSGLGGGSFMLYSDGRTVKAF